MILWSNLYTVSFLWWSLYQKFLSTEWLHLFPALEESETCFVSSSVIDQFINLMSNQCFTFSFQMLKTQVSLLTLSWHTSDHPLNESRSAVSFFYLPSMLTCNFFKPLDFSVKTYICFFCNIISVLSNSIIWSLPSTKKIWQEHKEQERLTSNQKFTRMKDWSSALFFHPSSFPSRSHLNHYSNLFFTHILLPDFLSFFFKSLHGPEFFE